MELLGILSGQPVSKEPVLDLEVWPAGGVDQWLADEQGVECLESRCLPFDLVQLPAPTVVDKPDHVGFTCAQTVAWVARTRVSG